MYFKLLRFSITGLILLSLFTFSACSTLPGDGGTSTITGKFMLNATMLQALYTRNIMVEMKKFTLFMVTIPLTTMKFELLTMALINLNI